MMPLAAVSAEFETTSDTWGLVFHEIEGERFVVAPDGVLARPPWRVDGRPALKLSNE